LIASVMNKVGDLSTKFNDGKPLWTVFRDKLPQSLQVWLSFAEQFRLFRTAHG
jgi:hypothetical protein